MRTSFDEGARPVFDILASTTCHGTTSNELNQVLSGEIDKPSCATAAMSVETTPRLSIGEQLRTYSSKLGSSWQLHASGSMDAAAVLVELDAQHVAAGGPQGIKEHGMTLIRENALDDTFYVYDLANVARLYRAWVAAMPRVQPFYAVKCNPEPAILKMLAALGAGFDCASQGELEAVHHLGVPQSNIIFAHPCKRPCDIRYAAKHNVRYTTFDTPMELRKIAAGCPDVRCVLRLRCDDPDAKFPLGSKYGAQFEDTEDLLRQAQELGLTVAGVSFHVGSGCQNLATFTHGIRQAREVFDMAAAMGIDTMELLDIGGGFLGIFDEAGNVVLDDLARTVNSALAVYFPPSTGVRVISEPGRYFAESSATVFTPVYGVRERRLPGGQTHMDYWVADGVYGTFNCLLYDYQRPQPLVLPADEVAGVAAPADMASAHSQATLQPTLSSGLTSTPSGSAPSGLPSTLWGPTCDSIDFIYKDVSMPHMGLGDWLLFPRCGAYTIAGACNFNGISMSQPKTFYVYSSCAVDSPGSAAAGPGALTGLGGPGTVPVAVGSDAAPECDISCEMRGGSTAGLPASSSCSDLSVDVDLVIVCDEEAEGMALCK